MVSASEHRQTGRQLGKKKFVFIHKSAQSNVRSRVELKDQREINRHVQRFSYEQRRSRNLMRYPRSAWMCRKVAAKAKFVPEDMASLVGGNEKGRSQSERVWNRSGLSVRARERSGQSVPGSICRPGCAMDPFMTTGITTKPWVYSVVDYFVNFWGLAAFKAEVEAAGSQKSLHREAIQEYTRSALHTPLLLYAMAAAVAARLHYVNGDDRPLSRYGTSPCAQWFLANAVRTLREHFANMMEGDEVDPAMIVAIYCIHNGEFMPGNYEASRIHLKIFDLLAKRMKGSDSMSFFCREIWALGDTWTSIETFLPPVFSPQYTPLPHFRIQEMYEQLLPSERKIGIGLSDNTDMFTSEMALVIQDLIEWARIAQFVWSSVPPIPSEARWLGRRASDLICQLLRISSPPPPALDDEVERQLSIPKHKQECVRITVVTLLSFILTYLGAKRSGKLNLARMKNALLNTLSHALLEYDEVWHPHQELFVWVLFIGTNVAELTAAEKAWFTSKFLTLAHLQGIENGFQLSQLLGRYLYFESLHGGTLQRLSKMLDAALTTSESDNSIWYGVIDGAEA